jgi:hypothetical protein
MANMDVELGFAELVAEVLQDRDVDQVQVVIY